MNFSDNGPLYPEDRPFYYDPEIKDTGMGGKEDERKLTKIKVLIFLIITLSLSILF